MRMDKLTHSLQAALGDAQSLAVGRDHPFIEPLHILKAMLIRLPPRLGHYSGAAGIQVEPLVASLEAALAASPTVSGSEDVHISQETQRLLNRADKLSQQAGDSYISTDSVLLAMMDSKSTSGLLSDAGVTAGCLIECDRARGAAKPLTRRSLRKRVRPWKNTPLT